MKNPDCEGYNFRTKTPVFSELIAEIDAHYEGGLSAWKLRYRPLVIRQRKNIEFLHIAASQLYETARLGRLDALDILDKVIACTSAHKCDQILCPACRDKRQIATADKAIAAFTDYSEHDIKFMTVLIRVVAEPNELPALMDEFRTKFWNSLRHNAKNFGTQTCPFKMIGAFEIDLKNLATLSDMSVRSRELVKTLGYNSKIVRSQYLLHLHAIVGPLDQERQGLLKNLVERSLGRELLPFQLNFRSLHENKSKNDNLSRLASYIFKARLQYADNIFDDNHMQKKTRYHTPYKGKVLIDYLNVINEMQNFKGLKFDFGA